MPKTRLTGKCGVIATLAARASHQGLASVIAAAVGSISLSGSALAQARAADVAAQNQTMFILLFWFAALVAGLIVLFIPAMIAIRRGHPNRWAIAVICLAFGGTIIGWFGALIWALQAVHKSATGSNGGESGLNIFVNDAVKVRIEPQDVVPLNAPSAIVLVDELSERLNRLKRLRENDTISADEYAAMRQFILASI